MRQGGIQGQYVGSEEETTSYEESNPVIPAYNPPITLTQLYIHGSTALVSHC